MYRAVTLMSERNAEAALEEINKILGFKLALECLEMSLCLYLCMDDYEAALQDIQAVLTLQGSFVHLCMSMSTTVDCWMQLYDKWSNVDDIGSLYVIYQLILLKVFFTLGNLFFSLGLIVLKHPCVFYS